MLFTPLHGEDGKFNGAKRMKHKWNKNAESKKWLKDKIYHHKKSPKETSTNIIIDTNNTIDQYLKSENSTTKGILASCLYHNKLFIEGYMNLNKCPFCGGNVKFIESFVIPDNISIHCKKCKTEFTFFDTKDNRTKDYLKITKRFNKRTKSIS